MGGRRTVLIKEEGNSKLGERISLANFNIIDRLGGGSFGTVYLV
jgi:hypothetical protein